jgi:hypothetical protein
MTEHPRTSLDATFDDRAGVPLLHDFLIDAAVPSLKFTQQQVPEPAGVVDPSGNRSFTLRDFSASASIASRAALRNVPQFPDTL